MPEPEINAFKRALAEQRKQIGLWSSLRSPIVADILGEAGFDWIVLDCEHAPNEVPDIMVQLMALRGGTATPVVRVAWNDQVMIKRVLDVGATALLVPMVQSAAEAKSAVEACRYPPGGIRGVATSMRASRYGRTLGYHRDANAGICLLVQVETRAGLAAIDAIAGTEGVDGIFIGPSDLSAALGHLGEANHPEVQAAIRHALERCRAAGKPAGILSGVEAEARRYLEMGYTFVAVGSDASLVAKSSLALAERFRKLVGS